MKREHPCFILVSQESIYNEEALRKFNKAFLIEFNRSVNAVQGSSCDQRRFTLFFFSIQSKRLQVFQ